MSSSAHLRIHAPLLTCLGLLCAASPLACSKSKPSNPSGAGARCDEPGACGDAADMGDDGGHGDGGSGDGGAVHVAEVFTPQKGPANGITLPYPGERDWRFADDDTWRYVAPRNAGHLHDAAYFNGQWFVLHGDRSSEDGDTNETGWLSATRDGLTWETLIVSTEPDGSYTRLASNGNSLLLLGTRHVAELVDDGVSVIAALDKDAGPVPTVIPHPDGYVIARTDDVLWLGLDRSLKVAHEQRGGQFRSGTLGPEGFLLFGASTALGSQDGQTWGVLSVHPCEGCMVTGGAAYGNGTYLVADTGNLFTSGDTVSWQTHAWERARYVPPDGITRIDYTAGHFLVLSERYNMLVSKDGTSWSGQLKIALGQIGPAACEDRCLVANGHLLLPPRVLPDPVPPPGADTDAPYYCAYGDPPPEGCPRCGSAGLGDCREGVYCLHDCSDSPCPQPDTGDATVMCDQNMGLHRCHLYCNEGERCPDGMQCSGGLCLYVFDDPLCDE